MARAKRALDPLDVSSRFKPKPNPSTSEDPEDRPGTGALCPEAQADGVPCSDLGRDCEICEQAEALRDRPEAP